MPADRFDFQTGHWRKIYRFPHSQAVTTLAGNSGPTLPLVISYALGHGKKIAKATVAVVALGDFTAMTAPILGLGALLATSATLFAVLKWVGAACLIYLVLNCGVRPSRCLLRVPVEADIQQVVPNDSPWRIMVHTSSVTASIPKSILFVAFLPHLHCGRCSRVRGSSLCWQL